MFLARNIFIYNRKLFKNICTFARRKKDEFEQIRNGKRKDRLRMQ